MPVMPASYLRVRFFRLREPLTAPPVQKSTICFVAVRVMALSCRFTSALACPRTEPKRALAPLSHMLKNGFFLIQGFRMRRDSRFNRPECISISV